MPAKFFLFLFLILGGAAIAQTDTSRTADSTVKNIAVQRLATDSLKNDSSLLPKKAKALTWQEDTAFNHFFYNKRLTGNKPAVYAINTVRQPVREDDSFYILTGLLLFAGIIRALFPKYFPTLFGVFFQSSQRQRQPDNVAQDALPSFLMNILFVLSGGLLLATFIKGDGLPWRLSFAGLWLYACAALATVYVAKSLFITFFGWVFGAQEPAGNYRFIVFLVNKMAGLFFMPLLLLLLYSGADIKVISTLIIMVIAALLLYRFIISLSLVGKKLNLHPLHFFLYLCAVEILPLLITYKVLLITKEL